MQWDKWICFRNLGWEWEMKPGVQRSARISCHSDSELPGGHCNDHFRFTVSRRQNTRLLHRRRMGGLSRGLWSLRGAAGMTRSSVTSLPVWKAHSPREVMAWAGRAAGTLSPAVLPSQSKTHCQCVVLTVDLKGFIIHNKTSFLLCNLRLPGPGLIPGFFVLGIWRQGWTT